jgi:HlyD family secretion protein
MRLVFYSFFYVVMMTTMGIAAQTQDAHAPAITVTTAVKRELVATLTVTGTLVSRDEVRVMAQIEGLAVTKIVAEEGDRVEQGQVLAKLDDVMIRTQLAQSSANFARAEAANIEAQKALLRTQELRKSGYATQAQLDQRMSAAKVAAADEAAAAAQRTEFQTRVARTEIKAPVKGMVAKRMAMVGMIANASTPLYTLVSNNEIELQAQIADSQHQLLKIGQPAQVLSANGDSQAIAGKVRLVSPQVDPATRLADIRISLTGENNFSVGGFARATIETARRTTLAVPLSAIAYHQDKASVQVAVDNKVKTQDVKLGITGDGYVEVVDGLREGDTIVVRAGTFLRDGDTITPIKAE